MANLITMHMLKLYAPSLVNRGESGEPKTVTVGNAVRSRVSSQCIKKAVRDHVGYNAIRSAHLYELVEKILLEMVSNGTITEKELPAVGTAACLALNCSWDKLKKDKKSNESGNTVVHATPEEIMTIINASVAAVRAVPMDDSSDMFDEAAEAGSEKMTSKKGKPKNNDDTKKIIENALNNVRISVDKALFGVMATGGALETVDGAVSVSNLYGIDEYIPENDYITATYSAGKVNEGDPFFGSFNEFNYEQSSSARAETIANRWEYSNTMLAKTAVNVDILRKNLSESITKKAMNISEDVVTAEMKTAVSDYLNALIEVTPSGNQTNLLTNSFPAICYFETVREGTAFYADPYFEKVIRDGKEKSISEQGIEKILDFAQSKKHLRGDVKRYVLLDDLYVKYEDDFKAAGVTVLHSIEEVDSMVAAEIERLSS